MGFSHGYGKVPGEKYAIEAIRKAYYLRPFEKTHDITAEILAGGFEVSRMSVVGGGTVNAGFLAAGLLDEISILLAPGIDGRKGMTATFGIMKPEGCAVTKFLTKSANCLL